jgi:MgsA AAA+ ATPase C terminal
MLSSQFQELIAYPETRWADAPSDRWRSLCDGLLAYKTSCARTFPMDKERKWELVSALQKSIRRGNKEMALHLVSAMDSMPEEYAYFWRRLCVIACEDVGPADDVLASFVVACSTVFPPKKTGSENRKIISFLAEQMCDLPTRSRIYCSYGAIEPVAIKGELPELALQDQSIVSDIMQNREAVQVPENPWREWQKKNDWRAEGLLRFVGLRLPFEMTQVEKPIPPSTILFDLPSYCYDMHTRVGLQVLQQLVRGVAGAEGIKDFFVENKIKNAHRALGQVLFFVEGARIEGELFYEPLCSLEQRLFAHQFGLPLHKWCDLRVLVEKALLGRVIDRVREEVLRQYYGQQNLQFDCTRRRLIQ